MSCTLLLVLFVSLKGCSYVMSETFINADFPLARNVCDLIWNEEIKYLNTINESALLDLDCKDRTSPKIKAYLEMVRDICKLNVDDSKQCMVCFLGKFGTNTTDEENLDRQRKCARRYTLPTGYSLARHFLDGTNDTFQIVFSQLFGACMNNMTQFLRGFSTLGFQFGMNNTQISEALLGKWLFRTYSLIGYINEKISSMPAGPEGFMFLKKACTLVHDTEVLEKVYLALMYNNTVNQEMGRKNCVKIYTTLGRGQTSS